MLVEVIGNTVSLIRRENEPTELIRDVRGFGHTFPEVYMMWDENVKGSVSHQRILRYRFGGFNFLVRFKGDGYIGDRVDDGAEEGYKSVLLPSVKDDDGEKEIDADDLLVAALGKAELGEKHSVIDSKLSVRRDNKKIPLKALSDLKTRWVKKDIDRVMESEIPRL